jgi:hypothetical protein
MRTASGAPPHSCARASGLGDGPTAEAAVADLRDALEALLAEVGPPDELTLTLDVA